MPSKTPSISVNKALLGTWITDEEDSNVAFAFSTKNNGYLVNGFCRSDGEEFEITRVKWNGKALSFVARMPSTSNVTKNVFRIRSDGKLDLELATYHVWKKKNVKPGQLPEAWRRAAGRPSPHTRVRRARVVA